MTDSKLPRLRTVDKVKPPYPLNQFPADFGHKLGKEIIYLLATKSISSLEGPEWEQIFASCIGAEWKPSNVGLDDVILNVCAWGAKTVKSPHPHNAKTIRLISGRNSPAYSFGQQNLNANTQSMGNNILEIWNARVEAVRAKFSHLRTVVLIKSDDLTELAVFEVETVLYPLDRFTWSRNQRGNLEAREKSTNIHRFTWQPHGSQFTIIESVPKECLLIRVKSPRKLDKNEVLKAINFDDDWVIVINRKKDG
jgi:hypothetical protein